MIIVFFVLFCFLGPLFYHTNQTTANLGATNLPPSSAHPLGTDEAGFDELGRIMIGGQAALEIGFFASFIATVIGTLYGAVSGLAGGVVDGLMMRIVDILLSIPFLFIVLVIATKVNGTVVELSLLIGLFSWLVPARLVRGEVLTLRTRDFVYAARVMGSGRPRLVVSASDPQRAVGRDRQRHLPGGGLDSRRWPTSGSSASGSTIPHVSWGDMLGNAQTLRRVRVLVARVPGRRLPRPRRPRRQPRRRRPP